MSITVDQIVDMLNRAVWADRDAISALVNHRVPCNEALANDPTIQVGLTSFHGIKSDAKNSVGLLGLLNGIAALEDPNKRIGAALDAPHGKVRYFIGNNAEDYDKQPTAPQA